MLEPVVQKLISIYYSLIPPTLYDTNMIFRTPHGSGLIAKLDIREDERVIEVGVGTGLNIEYYPLTADIHCVDISRRMLKLASKEADRLKRDNITFRQGDARYLPYEDNAFDVGILTYALSAIPGNKKALSEMERVVKPGGRIGILDFKGFLLPNPLEGGHVALNLPELVSKRLASRIIYQEPTRHLFSNYGTYILEVQPKPA